MRRALSLCFSMLLILMFSVVIDLLFAIEVDDIVKNFRRNYSKTKSFSADFEQTTIIAGRKRVATGKLSFQKPNLLRQEYFDPSDPNNFTQLIISDGKTLFSYTPVIKQVTKQDLPSGKGGVELFPGFGQSLENVEKNYNLRLVKDELAEKHGVHVLELTPKEQKKAEGSMFDVMQVWIRDEDSVPVQIMYKDNKNQTTFFLSFKNARINDEIKESTFKFVIPKGAQVITVPNR